MDQSRIPIDLAGTKLLDWLIDRRHCDIKWVDQAKDCESRWNELITDLPENCRQIPQDYGFNIFSVKVIVKNLSKMSQSMVQPTYLEKWNKLLADLELKGIGIAQAASVFMNLFNNRIPACKSSLASSQSSIQSNERKIKDFNTQLSLLVSREKQKCSKYGIPGENVQTELKRKLHGFSDQLDSLTEQFLGLNEAIIHFETMHKFTFCDAKESIVPSLHSLVIEGKCHILRSSIPGNTFASIQLNEIHDGAKEETDAICWDISEMQCDEIEDGEFKILGISEAGDSEKENDIRTHSPVKHDLDGTVNVLEDNNIRNSLEDELLKLKCFLSQRIKMVEKEEEVFSKFGTCSFDGLESISLVSVQSLNEWKNKCSEIYNSITSDAVKSFFKIRDDQGFIQRIIKDLDDSKKRILNQQEKIKKLEQAEISCSKDIARSQEKMLSLLKTCQYLQQNICQHISSIYQNRTVNILGDVNGLYHLIS